MDKIEELKKQVHCEKCHKIYDDGSWKYIHPKCQHHICDSCFDSALSAQRSNYKCPICKAPISLVNKLKFKHDTTSLLKVYEFSVAKSAEGETKLKSEISILKQQQTVYKTAQKNLRNTILKLEKEQEISRHNQVLLEAQREDHHKCSGCETTDFEQNMQLCVTCHELKFEDLEDVKRNALCSTCAIKKHMRKGHQIVDFFPYLSAYNFSSHSPKIDSESEELKSARDSLNNTFSDFNALSINLSENYDVLTDMARRSKSTKNQLEFVEKMETFIKESNTIHFGADSELKERSKLLQEMLTKIKDWYNSKMDNCVDDSETIKLGAPAESDNP